MLVEVRVSVGVAVSDAESEPERERDGVSLGVCDADAPALCVALGVAVSVSRLDWDAVGDVDGVHVALEVAVAVADAEGVSLGESLPVGSSSGVVDGDDPWVVEAVGEPESVDKLVAELDEDAVEVMVDDGVGVGVLVLVAVCDCVALGLPSFELVMEAVTPPISVNVGVFVKESDGDVLGVAVTELVGEEDGV